MKTIKKLISFLTALVMLSAFALPSYAATLTFSLFPNFEKRNLRVTGTSNADRMLTFYVTDEGISASEISFDNNIYAMHQETVGKDGNFDITLNFPQTMPEGTYKLIIGGIGLNAEESLRSRNFNYMSIEGKAFLLEAENASGTENWVTEKNSEASNGQYLRIFEETPTFTPEEAALNWTVDIEEGTDYDIFALVIETGAYTSSHTFSVNGDKATGNTLISESLYTPNLGNSHYGKMHWARVRSDLPMGVGKNTITYKPTYSSLFDTRILTGVDAVYIVPSSWNWEPYMLTEPVNEKRTKINYVSGSLANTKTDRGGTVSAKLYLSVPEAADYNIPIWIEMRYKGELVARKQMMMPTPMNKWLVGYPVKVEPVIDVPLVAPDGEYEIYCGVGSHTGFANVEGEKLIGNVTIGELDDPNPDTLTISRAEAAQNGKMLDISYTLSEAAEATEAKAFVRFWNGDVLWGVAETEAAVDVSTVGEVINTSLVMPSGMPAGEYEAELGFYNVNGTKTIGNIRIISDTKNTYKPLSHGIYKSQKTGRHHFWYINQAGAAIWDGEPFIPMGGMYCPNILSGYSFTNLDSNVANWNEDKREIDILVNNGIKDLYLNASVTKSPTWVWEYVLDYLDERGIRYGIQSNGGTPYTEQDSFYIFSNESKIGTSVTTSQAGDKTVTLNNARLSTIGGSEPNYAIYTVVNSSGNVVSAGKAEMTSAETSGYYNFAATVTLPNAETYTVYFTPNVNNYAGVVNFWKYGEAMLNHAKKFASKVAIGDGVRDIIDPTVNESGYFNYNANVRPYDDDYNELYRMWLQDKYGNIEKLRTAWTNNEILDFAQASRVVPVYTSGTDAAGNYTIFGYDEKKEAFFEFNGRTTQMWLDFIEFRDYAAAEFYNDLADAYKTKLDIPVVVKNVYFHQESFKNSRLSGGIDGIGSESYAIGDSVGQKHMVSYGLTRQFAKTGWSIVTETNTNENIAQKHKEAFGENPSYNEDGSIKIVDTSKVGYGTKERMHDNFDQLLDSGAKGIYDFVLSARHNQPTQEAYSYIYFNDRFGSYNLDHFSWLKEYKEKVDNNADTIANTKIDKNVIYFTPAAAYTNGGGPDRFNAVHVSDNKRITYPYKAAGRNKDYAVLLTDDPTVDTEFIAANFERGPVSNKQGVAFGNMLDTMEGDKVALYLGFRYDIGTVPQIDKYFTNEFTTNSNGVSVQVLDPGETGEVIYKTAKGEPWAIRDGNLWIVAAADWITKSSYWDRGTLNYIDELGIFMDDSGIVMQDYGFENESGVVIDSIEKGDQTLKVRIKNNTNDETDVTMYAASYDGSGNLLRVSKKTRTLFSGLNYIETDLKLEGTEASAKGFIWDKDMKPIQDVLEIK